MMARYGKAVARQAIDLYEAAMDCPVDWRTATMDTALSVLHQFLEERYPWLSAKARTKLNYAFLMNWK